EFQPGRWVAACEGARIEGAAIVSLPLRRRACLEASAGVAGGRRAEGLPITFVRASNRRRRPVANIGRSHKVAIERMRVVPRLQCKAAVTQLDGSLGIAIN